MHRHQYDEHGSRLGCTTAPNGIRRSSGPTRSRSIWQLRGSSVKGITTFYPCVLPFSFSSSFFRLCFSGLMVVLFPLAYKTDAGRLLRLAWLPVPPHVASYCIIRSRAFLDSNRALGSCEEISPAGLRHDVGNKLRARWEALCESRDPPASLDFRLRTSNFD